MTNEDRSSNCVRIASKITHFNSVNSEIMGWKFIKFVHHVQLLSFSLLKVVSQFK